MKPQWNPEDLYGPCATLPPPLSRADTASAIIRPRAFAAGCRCRVGMFAVKKKNGEQRLVLARSSPCYFDDPPKAHLASGQAFASIEVEPGQQAWLGIVDVQVAFYAMQLPAALMTYFGLPYHVRAGDVGIKSLDGVACLRGSVSCQCSPRSLWGEPTHWRCATRS